METNNKEVVNVEYAEGVNEPKIPSYCKELTRTETKRYEQRRRLSPEAFMEHSVPVDDTEEE